MVEIKINGLSDLQTRLDQIPAKFERNVLRGGLRKGAKDELLPEMRRNVSSQSGELAAGLKVGTRSKGGRVWAYVRAAGRHAHIAKWLEFGTKAHDITVKAQGGWLSFGGWFAKSVRHPGIAPYGNKAGTGPYSFMRRSMDAKASAIVLAVANYCKQRLESKHGLDTSDLSFGTEE